MADAGKLDSPIQLALPQTAQGMPKDIQPYFQDIYDAIYQIQLALVNFVGVAPQPKSIWNQLTARQSVFTQNSHRLYIQATEAIAVGAVVNIFNSGGAAKIRNASASSFGTVKPAHGISNSPALALGEYGEIFVFEGLSTLYSGLTPGQSYYLSLTPGLIQNVPVVTAGNLEQFLGIALDANTFLFSCAMNYVQH